MLFGSQARGTSRGMSDVDIGIWPEDSNLALGDELKLQVDLTRLLAREVDIVRLDHAPTLVRYEVAKAGVPLYEATPFAAARFTAAAVSEYLDFEPALRRAARLFRRRVAEGCGPVSSSPEAND
jgi:predicted nucleotidyltransferase